MSDVQLSPAWLSEVKWDANGLVPAIAQEAATGKVLMLAWMNSESLALTVKTGHAVYWSRSRSRLWAKGETSGHKQRIEEIRVDCDGDAILLKVEQLGGIACHTGRHNCFFKRLDHEHWVECGPIIKNPSDIYQD